MYSIVNYAWWFICLPELGIFLAAFLPTLAVASINTVYFTNRQICYSLLLASAIGVLCSLVLHMILLLLATGLQGEGELKILYSFIYNSFSFLACGAVFYIMHERFVTDVLCTSTKNTRIALVVSCLLLIANGMLGIIITNCLFLVCGLFCLYDLTTNWNTIKFVFITDTNDNQQQTYTESTAFTHKPNVYLLFLESIQPSPTLKTTMNIEVDSVERSLFDNGFKIYNNVYSNKFLTDVSLNTILTMKMTFLDFPTVLHMFKLNQYKISFFDNTTYLTGNYQNYLSETNFSKNIWWTKFTPVLFLQTKFFNYFGEIDLDCRYKKLTFSTIIKQFASRLEHKDYHSQNNFWILRFGADHANLRTHYAQNNAFASEYTHLYESCTKDLAYVYDSINNNDPDAIVIAIGDHGCHRWHNIWQGQGSNVNDLIRSRGQEPSVVASDSFSVLFAMKSQETIVPDQTTISHINLFRYIFRFLTGDESWTRELSENVSIVENRWVAVREGITLKEWEEADSEESMLLKMYSTADAIKHLQNQLSRYKNSFTYSMALSSLFVTINKLDEALLLTEDCMAAFPKRYEIHLLRANIFFKLNKLDSFFRSLQYALKVEPYCWDLVLKNCPTLRQLGKQVEASLLAKQIISITTNCAEAYLEISYCQEDAGDIDSALNSVHAALVANLSFIPAKKQFMKLLVLKNGTLPLNFCQAITKEGIISNYFEAGWSTPEDSGTWTVGTNASMNFQVSSSTECLLVTCRSFIAPLHPSQRIEVEIDGTMVFESIIATHDLQILKLRIPVAKPKTPNVTHRTLHLEFGTPDAARPCDVGGNKDCRQLGIFIRDITPITSNYVIKFGSMESILYLGAGWSRPEPWGVWSATTRVNIDLPMLRSPVRICVQVNPFLTPQLSQQRAVIRINSIIVLTTVMDTKPSQLEFLVPQECISEASSEPYMVHIEIELPDATRPCDIGWNADTRKLAIGLISLTVSSLLETPESLTVSHKQTL